MSTGGPRGLKTGRDAAIYLEFKLLPKLASELVN
jgi:hypothetical protein